jgi:hypothetical protein
MIVYLSGWAAAFLRNYRLDDELSAAIHGTPHTKSHHLREFVFPDEKVPPGPSIRAGDFT